MSLFADYLPKAHGRTAKGVAIEFAGDRDVQALARIAALREGRDREELALGFQGELRLAEDGQRLWVARHGASTVAFARASRVQRPPACAPNHQPQGWYLSGVIVDPPWRRRGIGKLLTRRRLEFLATRTQEVFYLVNAQNRASIDLHEEFGFEERTRDFVAPGVSFTGGVGILLRLDLERWARQDRGGE